MTHAHPHGPHKASETSKLNWFRTGVLEADDGVVSTVLILLDAIAAGSSHGTILTADAVAVIAGAISTALGEYVSVSIQRDIERALITKEKIELKDFPDKKHNELVGVPSGYSVPEHIAEDVARGIAQDDPLIIHLKLELSIDGGELTNPWATAGSSALSSLLGIILPMVATLAFTGPASGTVAITVVTIVTLALTGYISARLDPTHSGEVMLRLVIGGALGLIVSYLVGLPFGQAVG